MLDLPAPAAPTVFIAPAGEDLADQVLAWLGSLRGERRMSEETLEAYGRDLRQFLTFQA